MKTILLIGLMALSGNVVIMAQDPPSAKQSKSIDRDHLVLRPNSRDYTLVRMGNNHQRIIQMRSQAMARNRQALLNRKAAMERQRSTTRSKMIRQQQIRQRMIRQRGMHR